MYNPVNTYRVQFHQDFTFSDFEQIIPYLFQLGIKTVYASPIFEAVPASMHGYDVTNPLNINPEIGTLVQLRSICKKLKKLGIGWLQDIVPNHMAFHPNNKWLMDVLENGRSSPYADVFDILWDVPGHGGKLMVPFLGKPLDEAIDAGELKIVEEDKLMVEYFGQRYPLNPSSYPYNDARINPNDPKFVRQLLDKQHYELCYWQETDHRINFRRFFTVNGLICLNMQDKKVFDRYHGLIKKLVDEGLFQGLRVDHIDGLYDPKTYLQRLRDLVGNDTYVIVEKILEKGEEFPTDWPVQGSTGYDFLATMNNLFTCRESKHAFSRFYKEIDPEQKPVQEQIYLKKQQILDNNMQGELHNLYRLFADLKLTDEYEANLDSEVFKKALAAILVHCPVYRFYGNTMPLAEGDAHGFEGLLKTISENVPELSEINEVLKKCLLLKPQMDDAGYRKRALHFYQRLMQFTGPLMAKGVEDTLMYTYNRFIDHNEVGDSPDSFGLKTKGFHELMRQRQEIWPHAMNASSTHDTKRGEDVRARLNVLSDIADRWIERVKEWAKINGPLKTSGAPDANDEYFIYQTLIGAYPMPGYHNEDFENRLHAYLEKALREAKRNTNWTEPNESYELAAKKFASALLNSGAEFRESFATFHRQVADFGIINSLAQTLLKYTAPGVPDLYQGCELWDLSLVDPDNRRRVDYRQRNKYLDSKADWQSLWEDRYNGQIKQSLIAKLLKERNSHPKIFEKGEYLPLKVKGKYKENIIAFARHYNRNWYLIVMPLHIAKLVDTVEDIPGFDWKDTRVVLPGAAPLSWRNILDDQKGYGPKTIAISDLFKTLPIALVQLERSKNERGAGVLMHITSLPSSFGIGDIGPEARKFADFLNKSRQKYWQMLPLNPIDGGAGYSPYSATSAMAGNVLLISPELLRDDGLLTEDDLKQNLSENNGVNFEKAIAVKRSLFDRAYLTFLNSANQQPFEEFKQSESWWLDDFALYQYLKDRFDDEPWYQWPQQYKFRHKAAMELIAGEIAIDKIKWLQYLFSRQWSSLRKYCYAKDITLLGDMPFYISYDSADVWANPRLFNIDKQGKITGIAGVPPDYFSVTGQLWGMPVYNWAKMGAQGYDWWIKRVKRNLQFFDLIRLDHFRAFSGYWEVAGGSENAIKGQWKPGPGSDFFEKLKNELGTLPFVAEDLGQIDDKVYRLRDTFSLPGMRVLQFAFDDAMPVSEHIPHNYTRNSFAYTGTHDNNTIKGWYEQDIDADTQNRVRQYTRTKISLKNIHKVMIRTCYASAARAAIIPMQDILGLDASARMNTPSSPEGNWKWQMEHKAITNKVIKYLRKLRIEFNR